MGTQGLWPQLKGELLKVQRPPRRAGPQFPGSQQLPKSSPKQAGMGMGRQGQGRGLEAHGNTDSDTRIPLQAAPLGTWSGRQLQLGAEAVLSPGKSPQNVSAQIRQAGGGVGVKESSKPRQRSECSVHLQTMAEAQFV